MAMIQDRARHRPSLVSATLILAGLATMGVAVYGQEQSAIYLLAVDEKGTPVLDLKMSDIAIKEDVGSSTIVSVRRFGWPLKVTVLVDNGPRTRDALVHFSNADIWRALNNIVSSDITFLATTTFPATTTNVDLITGIGWRYLNLQAAPFNFPPPLMSLPEGFNRLDQVLSVWRVSDIRGYADHPAAHTDRERYKHSKLA